MNGSIVHAIDQVLVRWAGFGSSQFLLIVASRFDGISSNAMTREAQGMRFFSPAALMK
jgi:hypothetical protein